MYDRPETRAAYDALWAAVRDGLRQRGLAAPDALDHEAHFMEAWGRDDLVLSQICNLPYRARYRDRVTLIGAADYGVDAVPPGYYRSVWVVRADDPATRVEDCAGYRLAFNDPMSHSGWGSAVADATERGLTLTPHLQTGAHLASIAAVASGAADLAAIDAVTWAMARRWDKPAQSLRPLGQTMGRPGQSFITARGQDPAPYFAAISDAIAAMPAEHKDATGLRGIVRLPVAAYDLPLPPEPATMTANAPMSASG